MDPGRPTRASRSTTEGIVGSEIGRDITEQLEVHATQALGKLIRRIAATGGIAAVGALGGFGLNEAVDDDPQEHRDHKPSNEAPALGGVSDPWPPELLVPPADEHILDACEAAGDDARRLIREARICIDQFAAARKSCDSVGEQLVPRARPKDP